MCALFRFMLVKLRERGETCLRNWKDEPLENLIREWKSFVPRERKNITPATFAKDCRRAMNYFYAQERLSERLYHLDEADDLLGSFMDDV